ncbi:cupin domain-containing protein [Kutzneria sp. NPDC052558]|uniref:cupin domain-containing protein n=1 Tax=Kutzneria sp. NPDC052558 TaxID=3364121 RepID=UPI0037C7EC03
MDWKAESAALRKKRGIDYEPLEPFVQGPTVERSIWYEGQMATVYARGAEVGQTCCFWEGVIPEHVGPPPHVHHYEHEVFFLRDGSITAYVEGEPLKATKDQLVFMPAGRIHWFVSTSPVTRMFGFTVTAAKQFPYVNDAPALFEMIGVPAQALTLPPTIEVKPMPEPAEIVRMTRDMGADMPDLERLGWRRNYNDKGEKVT